MTMLSIKHDEHMFENKYRPSTIDEIILPKKDKEIFQSYVKKGKIPHMVLQSASPGTGKTSVALALCNDINADMIFVNGSDCKIDFVRNELTRFASSLSIDGRQKVIVIDEFDRPGLTESQRHLRTFMEAYSSNCSIIMTANNIEGIIEPIRSRSHVVQFGAPTEEDKKEMMKQMIVRCISICEKEGIEVKDKKIIAALVKKNFPDFRKTVNQLDHCSATGVVDESVIDLVIKNRASIEPVIEAIQKKDIRALKLLSVKYSVDYPNFIEKLAEALYTSVKKTSILNMYEIIGENNAFFELSGSKDIHIMYLLTRLAVEMEF